jgi:hypothetical protein
MRPSETAPGHVHDGRVAVDGAARRIGGRLADCYARGLEAAQRGSIRLPVAQEDEERPEKPRGCGPSVHLPVTPAAGGLFSDR